METIIVDNPTVETSPITEIVNQLDAKDRVHLAEESLVSMRSAYDVYFNEIEAIKSTALAITVTSADQIETIEQADEYRKKAKKIRTTIEKRRKELKADSLARGKAIDLVAKVLTEMVEPIETHCEAQVQYVVLQEAKRKAELKKQREELLLPFEVRVTLFDLENMDEEEFQVLLKSSEETYNLKKAEAERKKAEEAEQARLAAEERLRLQKEAEENRKAAEAAEKARKEAELELRKAEEQRAALENAAKEAEANRLLAEKKAKEAAEKAEADRLLAEKKAKEAQEKAEQDRILAQKKAEADAKAKDEEIARLKAQQAENERMRQEKVAGETAQTTQALNARLSDYEKFYDWAQRIEAISLPAVDSDRYKAVLPKLEELKGKIAKYARDWAQNLK